MCVNRQSRRRGCKTDALGHRGTRGVRRDNGGLLSRSSRLCPRLFRHRQGLLRCHTIVEAQGKSCVPSASTRARARALYLSDCFVEIKIHAIHTHARARVFPWNLSQVENECGEIPTVLVQNKIDLVEQCVIDPWVDRPCVVVSFFLFFFSFALL